MLESEIQAKVIKELERHGWCVIKLIQTNKNGMPDLLCHLDGVTKYIEVKRNNLRPTPLQDHRHRELMGAGIVVLTVNKVDDLYLYGVLNAQNDPGTYRKSRRAIYQPAGNPWK